ncbi:MAG: hypothetical protein COA68_07720 [Oceanobacter sp.]|jgi:hypothetical protein|nr:MAG: hypothetical protein COA68_07720 [Oceanobacter sp.]
MNADQIIAILVDEIIKSVSPDFLIKELNFMNGRRRADLTFGSNGELYSFEIKSRFDNLSKLAEQTSDYIRCFDYSYIVVNKSHLSSARKIANKKLGIILEQNGALKIMRRATKIKRLDKYSVLTLISGKDISQSFKVSSSNVKAFDTHTIKKMISKEHTLAEIKYRIYSKLKENHSSNLQFLLDETGDIVHVDDLLYISRKNATKILNR